LTLTGQDSLSSVVQKTTTFVIDFECLQRIEIPKLIIHCYSGLASLTLSGKRKQKESRVQFLCCIAVLAINYQLTNWPPTIALIKLSSLSIKSRGKEQQQKKLNYARPVSRYLPFMTASSAQKANYLCDENVRQIASDERSHEEHAARTLNA
jgi:hypothetical protein